MRDYELAFVIRPDLEDEAFDAVTERVAGYVQAVGGEVTKTDVWGQRRLAYPIRKYVEGYYILMQTQMAPNALTELERNLRLNEDVIRHLVVRTDE
jgi:small subunit ribosomal protein S6